MEEKDLYYTRKKKTDVVKTSWKYANSDAELEMSVFFFFLSVTPTR